jgi:uncharacterized protein
MPGHVKPGPSGSIVSSVSLSSPAVSDLTALALNAAGGLPVEDLHGTVCGVAAGSGAGASLQALYGLLGDDLVSETAVGDFVDAAVAALDADDFTFAPLLPEDDAALDARLDALGGWCASFLTGFAAGLAGRGISSLDDCPDEVRELVRDLSAIAQIEADSPGESAEHDLLELEEFVKVGVLLIRSLLAHDDDSTG